MVNQVSRMDQIVRSSVDDKQFMGSILVVQNGQVILDKGYGYANIEWQIPNSPTTKFRLGSVTKQFTAVSILLLEEQGKLKISDLVHKYMPDAPAAWANITIHHLLTHASGIPNYTNFPDFAAMTTSPKTPQQLLELFRNKPLDFQPGSGYVYNNSGYVLLGYLIEKISGQSYQDFVVTNLLKPLSMNDSGYDSHSEIIVQRASGYIKAATEFHNADYLDMSIPYAAGSLYSTTHDLHKWVENLFTEKVISLTSLKKMITPNANDYGFGVIIQPVDGSTVIMHGGGINGFNTMLLHSPEDRLTVIILANLNGIGFVPGDLVTKLVTVAHGDSVILPSDRKEIVLSNKVLNKFAGTYKLKSMSKSYPMPMSDFVISFENDYLMAELANKTKARLIPESDNTFFGKIPDMQIDFMLAADGSILKFILRQDGDEYIGIPA